MTMFLSIVVFIAIGALVAFLGTRLFRGASLAIAMVLGIVGSLGISWVANLLGLGAGFMALSLWGVVFGVLGACLLVAVYGLISRRRNSHA